MPELPEVETIVRDLKKRIISRRIKDVWTDFKKMIKRPNSFNEFKRGVIGKTIKKVERRGKNILIGLSENMTLLVHQKLTGHLLLGGWRQVNGRWKSLIKGPLADDPMNRFLHLIFFFDNNEQLALSDLRKFAKIELWHNNQLKESKIFKKLGIEPLSKDFTFEKFKSILKGRKGKIKQILMNQELIAGIGNIYSDEILWYAKVHPLKRLEDLDDKELRRIYTSIKIILKKAISLRGESISDYRDIDGYRGKFDKLRRVYRREGKSCFRCGTRIKRLKIGGRSAYFCPRCQHL